ncbi:MAG: PilW family protein [Halioglobus sp.]|nr:PilW family protein [Halioglobus sp.]
MARAASAAAVAEAARAARMRGARWSGLCRGLSLVELLVALAIGVVLCFGAMNLLLHSKLSYLEAEELARLQESGRHALRYISYELAMAGHLAALLPGTRVPPVESGSPCFDHLMQTQRAVEHLNDVNPAGEPGAGGTGLPADCLLAGRHIPGTDVLLTRRSASAPAAVGAVPGGGVNADDLYLLAAPDYASYQLQRGGAGLQARGELWEYLPQVLFLRNYSRSVGDGVPALCRKRPGRSANGMAPAECLVEGVENLQLEFGIDEDGDHRPDRYEPAPDAAQLQAAVAARIYLLLRSIHPLPGHRDERSYFLGNRRVTAAEDGHYRRLMQTTVLLRNQGGFSR